MCQIHAFIVFGSVLVCHNCIISQWCKPALSKLGLCIGHEIKNLDGATHRRQIGHEQEDKYQQLETTQEIAQWVHGTWLDRLLQLQFNRAYNK